MDAKEMEMEDSVTDPNGLGDGKEDVEAVTEDVMDDNEETETVPQDVINGNEDNEKVPKDLVDDEENDENNQLDMKEGFKQEELPDLEAEHKLNQDIIGTGDPNTVDNGVDCQGIDSTGVCTQKPKNALEEQSLTRNVGEQTSPNHGGQEAVDLPMDEAYDEEKELSDDPDEKTPATAMDDDNGNVAAASGNVQHIKSETANNDSSCVERHEFATPIAHATRLATRARDQSAETPKVWTDQVFEGDESGTPADQAAFIKELESFYRERSLEFKPPKFYGVPLNLLKLWRAVIKLGGYDLVTGTKLWRQVGESFHPPKTCTTVSWTFRIFYEKSLLDYERYKAQCGELDFSISAIPEPPSTIENEANGSQAAGSGRARRDAAARAMQGWHSQRLMGNGEVGEPIIKEKNVNNLQKREKSVKSIGSLKQKRPNEVEHAVKVARTDTSKQLITTVVDVGPPADWVKVNVRETKDSFEVYALVPGLLRDEVRVQSDPAGRLVITGHPDDPDNPWGITSFKKVVSLPARIDPFQTSAVVSHHGRLFVRVPFEQSDM